MIQSNSCYPELQCPNSGQSLSLQLFVKIKEDNGLWAQAIAEAYRLMCVLHQRWMTRCSTLLTALKDLHSTIFLWAHTIYKSKLWVEKSPWVDACVWVGVYVGVPWHHCVWICVVAHHHGKFPLTSFSHCLRINISTCEQRSLVLPWRMHAKQRSLQFRVTLQSVLL